jgi:hypothetical protein
MDRVGQQSGAAGGAAVQQTNKWEREFSQVGEGGTRYIMQPWDPLPRFGRSHVNSHYPDPQGFMRMNTALAVMESITKALNELLCSQQKCKKTRSGKVFGMEKEDKAPTELHIYGGWPDWENTRYDYQYEALEAKTYDEGIYRQEELGKALGLCQDLESLRLENMEFYWKPKEQNVQCFFANLRNCYKLKKLAVVNQADGGDRMRFIIPEVCKLPLRELDLTGNRLYRNDMFPVEEEELERETNFLEILGVLGTCKTLESLSLADMNLMLGPGPAQDDATTRVVLRLMQELPLLKTLDLSENEIHADAQAAIEAAKPATLEVTF